MSVILVSVTAATSRIATILMAATSASVYLDLTATDVNATVLIVAVVVVIVVV